MAHVSEQDFYKRFEDWFSRFLEGNPVAATQLGDHRFDHRLGEHSAQARAREEKLLREALAELEAANTEGWSLDAQVDHTLVVRLVRSFLREFQKRRVFERNPSFYLMEAVGGVGLLLLRDFAPFPKRLESVRGRLSEVPRVLREGKENLEPRKVPKVWAEIALEGARRSLPFFRFVIPVLSLGVPRLAPKIMRESRRAARALSDYALFLEREILPKAQGDFAAGKELFEEILHEDHMLPYSAEELLELGWRILEETRREMDALAKKIAPGKSAREIIEDAKNHYPRPGELLFVYRREMAKAREFVEKKGIMTIPEGEKLVVKPTPPALRATMPYAAYMMPGPLEEKQEGIFLVTPVERFLPRQVREEKLRGHNFAKIPVTVVHEAYPGHHLQLVFANRYAKTLPRKLGSALSSLFVEGWAFYCEELMESLGYLADPVQKLARLQDQLWRAARIILDVSLHVKGMSVEEGVEFLVREAGLERTNALAEVRRYTMSPTQPLSYLVGKLEILKLIENYKNRRPGASLREIHDAILSCGSLPPRLLARLLL
ncbi:DUF885 domain-containing protein [Candidatus Bipolaricaulota bacterium]|nr:DUF885 domain-containing protein [Candidatus Bipolaricaulota bacterium]